MSKLKGRSLLFRFIFDFATTFTAIAINEATLFDVEEAFFIELPFMVTVSAQCVAFVFFTRFWAFER